MRNAPKLLFGWGVTALVLFIAGIYELVELRLQHGDVFPAYSSFRSDAFGAKALYRSLEETPGLAVRRHYEPLAKLNGSKITVFYLGADYTLLELREHARELQDLANGGARVVMTFLPVHRDPKKRTISTVSEIWGFGLGLQHPPKGKKDDDEDEAYSPGDFEEPDPLRANGAGLYFDKLGPEWKTLDADKGNATVIERKFGKGAVVFSSNSSMLSNKALLTNRRTPLIADLIGPNSNIVFDEYHHDTRDEKSIGTLARRYRLQWAVLSLLVLAALFLWKSMTSFLPRTQESGPQDEVLGRDASAGLSGLLARAVAPADLIRVCVEEWQKSGALMRRYPEAKLKRMTEAASGKHDPLAAYKTISQILIERD
jgi:hypothetical protein